MIDDYRKAQSDPNNDSRRLMDELNLVKNELAVLKQAPKIVPVASPKSTSSPSASSGSDAQLQARVESLAAELARQQQAVTANVVGTEIHGKLLSEVEHLKAELATVKNQQPIPGGNGTNQGVSKELQTLSDELRRMKEGMTANAAAAAAAAVAAATAAVSSRAPPPSAPSTSPHASSKPSVSVAAAASATESPSSASTRRELREREKQLQQAEKDVLQAKLDAVAQELSSLRTESRRALEEKAKAAAAAAATPAPSQPAILPHGGTTPARSGTPVPATIIPQSQSSAASITASSSKPSSTSLADMTPRTRQGIETLIAQKVAEAIAPVAAAAADSAAVSTAAAAAVAAVVQAPAASPVITARRRPTANGTSGSKTPAAASSSSRPGSTRSKTRRVPATDARQSSSNGAPSSSATTAPSTTSHSTRPNAATIASMRSPPVPVSASLIRPSTMTGAAVRAAAIYEWEHDVQQRGVRDRVAAILHDTTLDDEDDDGTSRDRHWDYKTNDTNHYSNTLSRSASMDNYHNGRAGHTSNGYHSHRSMNGSGNDARHTQSQSLLVSMAARTNGRHPAAHQHKLHQSHQQTQEELDLDGQLSWRAPLYVPGEQRDEGSEEAEERNIAHAAKLERDRERQRHAHGIITPREVWEEDYGTHGNGNDAKHNSNGARVIPSSNVSADAHHEARQLADIKQQLEQTLSASSSDTAPPLKLSSSTSALPLPTNGPLMSPDSNSNGNSVSLLEFYNSAQTRAPRSLVRSATRARNHMNGANGIASSTLSGNPNRLAVPVGDPVVRNLSYTQPSSSSSSLGLPSQAWSKSHDDNNINDANGKSAAMRIQERSTRVANLTELSPQVAAMRRVRPQSASRTGTRSSAATASVMNRYPLGGTVPASMIAAGESPTPSVHSVGHHGNSMPRHTSLASRGHSDEISPSPSLSSLSRVSNGNGNMKDDGDISSNDGSVTGMSMSMASPLVGLDLDRLLRVTAPSPALGRARALHTSTPSSLLSLSKSATVSSSKSLTSSSSSSIASSKSRTASRATSVGRR